MSDLTPQPDRVPESEMAALDFPVPLVPLKKDKKGRRRTPKARQIRTQEKRAQALALRSSGKSLVAIAKEMKISPPRVQQLIQEAIQQNNVAIASQTVYYRNLQNYRIDEVLTAIWPLVLIGDADAVAAFIKLEERRAKLLGLDAPTKVQVGMTFEELPKDQLEATARRMGLQFTTRPDINAIPDLEHIPLVVRVKSHVERCDPVEGTDDDGPRIVEATVGAGNEAGDPTEP